MPTAPSAPLIGFGQVRHARLRPAVHRFSYRAYFLRLPLRTLAATPWKSRMLGINRAAPMAVLDRDHGDGRRLPRVARRAAGRPRDDRRRRRGLAAAFPRVFGYVFKPVSFWYCHRGDGTLRAIVVEVNNTFGERHCYLLAGRRPRAGARAPGAQGVPCVAVLRDRGRLPLPLLLAATGSAHRRPHRPRRRATGPLLQTSVAARWQPATAARLPRALLGYPAVDPRRDRAHPLAGAAAVAEARALLLEAGAAGHPVTRRPMNRTRPAHDGGIAAARFPSHGARRCCACSEPVARSLDVQLPDGQRASFGSREARPCRPVLHNWNVCAAALSSGDIGFAEALHRRRLDFARPGAAARVLRAQPRGDRRGDLRHVDAGRLAAPPPAPAATATRGAGSRSNIHAHYDLGNAFYRAVAGPDDELLERMVRRLPHARNATGRRRRTRSAARARRAAAAARAAACSRSAAAGARSPRRRARRGACVRASRCRPSSSTARSARPRVRRADATCGCRTTATSRDGPYDAIASIEMFEAVGEAYWPRTSRPCAMLKPGGRACVQTIVDRRRLFERYVVGTDFIQQYIFPGGLLPSPPAFRQPAQRAGLDVVDALAFGPTMRGRCATGASASTRSARPCARSVSTSASSASGSSTLPTARRRSHGATPMSSSSRCARRVARWSRWRCSSAGRCSPACRLTSAAR